MDDRADAGRCAVVVAVVYAVLALFVLTEKLGQTTNDTRLELTEDPGRYLAGTFSLWNPQVSLGELQNQAYGYLFPQGAYFALLDSLSVPAWVSQRFWSLLLLLVACEGVRRLGRHLLQSPWAAAAAGLAYGLAPRHIEELGVRSAEILPGAVLPWALLPIVQAIDGRRRPRDAAVLSAAAYAFSGGVNGTATAAPVALLVVVVVWAVWRRHLSPRFALGWAALIAAVSAWWVVSLLRLGVYSPPFFDYVEDARTTTATSGFAASLRGASNWVGYLVVSGERWWPAGYSVSFEPWVVLGTGVVAALGLVGLLRYHGRLRGPFLFAAGLGLACQVIAHTGPLDGPLSPWLQGLLDGPLAPLRNVPKADPILRVPLAVGVGVLVDDVVRQLARRPAPSGTRGPVRRAAAAGLTVALLTGLVAMATPVAQQQTRTPGWDRFPEYWTDAADYLVQRRADRLGEEARGGGAGATWVIPGSGFAVQNWGWTMEEPMHAVARSPWVTRSQVPLTPAATIRMLSTLESYLETGAGSPYLQAMLTRIGVDTVLVRHDLDPEVTGVTPSSLVSVALARSPGLRRVRTFGHLEFGPAIEVFAVQRNQGSAAIRTGGYDVRELADTVTAASSVEDAIAAVGAGLVGPGEPIAVPGTEGWSPDRPADVVGDGYRRRERSFGRIHDAESDVMAPDEPYRGNRVVPNYPGPTGARPVTARYLGIAGVAASSSAGWVDALGQVRPETAPWSALDGDESTYWQPAPLLDATDQWLRVDLGNERTVGTVSLQEPVAVAGGQRVERWRVTAGGVTRTVEPDPMTGRAVVDLGDVPATSVRIDVDAVADPSDTIGLAEVVIDGVEPGRTLVVPPVPQDGIPDFVFSARPEARSCVTTLLGPDCDLDRQRAAEEATGIDRTFTVERAGSWQVAGLVVARSRPGTAELLDPLGPLSVRASSWYGQDPTVGPRMAYDADPATSWVADPRDREPTLTIDLGAVRTLRALSVQPPAGLAAVPDRAVIEAGSQEREVDLDGVGSFEPLRARHLTITFDAAAGDERPVGVSELRLDGSGLTRPLDGSLSTGAVCGLGPQLVVDGRLVETRVEGNLGAIVSGGQLAVRPCGDGSPRLRLGAGVHRARLLSTEQFQPVALTLSDAHRPAVTRGRSLELLSTSDTRVELEIGPGIDAVISAPHNVNAGWVATVDGTELEPAVVDGWAQGWVLPEGTDGRVVLSYRPQVGYLVGLVGGLVLLGAVLLWACWILARDRLRRRRDQAPDDPLVREPAAGRAGRLPGAAPTSATALTAVTAALVGWLVGGPLVAAGAATGVVLRRWPRLAQVLTGTALLVALAIWVGALADEPGLPPSTVDLITGTAVALGLGSSVRPARVGTREPARAAPGGDP